MTVSICVIICLYNHFWCRTQLVLLPYLCTTSLHEWLGYKPVLNGCTISFIGNRNQETDFHLLAKGCGTVKSYLFFFFFSCPFFLSHTLPFSLVGAKSPWAERPLFAPDVCMSLTHWEHFLVQVQMGYCKEDNNKTSKSDVLISIWQHHLWNGNTCLYMLWENIFTCIFSWNSPTEVQT